MYDIDFLGFKLIAFSKNNLAESKSFFLRKKYFCLLDLRSLCLYFYPFFNIYLKSPYYVYLLI